MIPSKEYHQDNSGPSEAELSVPDIPLHGRHLIEASAGTGKTYNITRLYLRLLLEKQLDVKDILVMTFTKAATEEIKGRVARTLREAATLWETAINNGGVLPEGTDAVFVHLYQHCDPTQSLAILKAAQLELTDASVFTIHGFCQHVIGQLAFSSGFAMTLNLSSDTSDLYLQAAEDWIRKISHNEREFLLLAEQGWHVPETLLSTFSSSVKSVLTPVLLDENSIEQAFIANLHANELTEPTNFEHHLDNIINNEPLIYKELISKPAHKATRPAELEALKTWLSNKEYVPIDPEAGAFLDGRRYSRNKSGVKEILAPIKAFADAIKNACADKQASLDKVPVFRLVNNAIDFIKSNVAAQKEQRGVIDFDDLIRMLADEVVKPGNRLVSELRKRFPVALIDEFQDTDAKQYAIVDAVYPKASKHHALFMIGDPKQAIYRFRGGDIFTYLHAGKQADYRWIMNTNWRSVESMVRAYNRLFNGAPVRSSNKNTESNDVFKFGIRYTPVNHTPLAEAAKHPLIDPMGARNAMNFVSMNLDQKSDANTMRRGLAQWIGQEIYRLLDEVTFDDNPARPVKPKDIAILVKNRTEASVIKYVLQQQGLSCVYLSDRSNLFATPEAKDVLRLLNGIWHNSDSSKVAASFASPLWGYSPQTLVNLLYHEDDELWDSAYEEVTSLRDMWLQKGCMSVLLYLMKEKYAPYGRDIERALTNYQHLAEVLEKASANYPGGEQLLDWLHKQIHQPQSDEEMTLRLESDSQLIRLVTQHGSKGLEYPIVFIPFASSYKDAAKNGTSYSQILTYYDENKQDLQLQLGTTKHAIERVRAEGDAEEMRLTYVAVTRAAHRCYMGIIPLEGNEKSALARALNVDSEKGRDWNTVLDAIAQEDDSFSEHISVDSVSLNYTSSQEKLDKTPLNVLEFSGTANENWRLYSFSALSRLTTHSSAYSPGLYQSIPVIQTERDEEIALADSVTSVGVLSESDINAAHAEQLRFTLEKGASAGNLLHDLLELNDFTEPLWEESGSELVTRFGLADDAVPQLYEWLDEVLMTPLYPTMSLRLCDLPMQQTLREAEFYFPMNASRWRGLRQILMQHRKCVANTLGGNVEPVPSLAVSELEGMMHGFIDLIFEYEGKYYVGDYKSTWLGNDIASYTPLALYANNQQHLYDLQYLIYCLALHRYLANTIENYNPEIHFGGVYYLYLRGMHPHNRQGEGVFFSPIDGQTLDALDGLFDGNNDTQDAVSERKESNE